MKKIIVLTVCITAITLVSAQVTENVRTMSKGNENALSLQIDGATKNQVNEAWIRTMKKYSKEKTQLSSAHNELFTDDASIKNVSENTIDIYAATIEKSSGGVELIVWFNLGGAYLSSGKHPDQYIAAKQFLLDFQETARLQVLEEMLAEEEKKQKDMEKDLRTMVNKGENLVQDIARLERQVQETKDALQANKSSIQDQEALLKEQEKTIDALKKEIKGKGN